MRVPFNSEDPRRWAADPENERRWESVFTRLRDEARERGLVGAALLTLREELSRVAAHRTSGEDTVLTVQGVRTVSGRRGHVVYTAPDAFTEWQTAVVFDKPFSAPPAVLLTAEVPPGNPPPQVVTLNVTAGGFTLRFTSDAVMQASVHFQAVGRD